ncbi:MAG: hypothetical protein Q9160_002437 [Pyrenula sp. 1 TL-2023]
MAAGLKTIIALSFVLAIGFLLVILSSALWHNYLPLLVVATYVAAPLPNWICSRCANPDDFMESAGNAIIDFGRFCTGFLVVMGVGMFWQYCRWASLLADGADFYNYSSARLVGSLRADPRAGNGHVNHRRTAYLRNNHQLYYVFPGRTGFLVQRHNAYI